MASNRTRTNKFIEALLEPLPDDALTDTNYNSLMRQARRQRWREAQTRTWYLEALARFQLSAALYAREIEGDTKKETANMEARHQTMPKLRRAVARQILTPAPDANAVAWKKNASKDGFLPITKQDIAEAIMLDEEFLSAHPVRRARSKSTGSSAGA